MKRLSNTHLFLMFILINTFTNGQLKGELQNINIPAPSLEGNLLGSAATQPAAIYLPPGYGTSDKKYPVVYFLGGYGDRVDYWTNGRYQGFRIKDVMDKLINNNAINQFIVVIVCGYNFLGGSFYVNSPVSGKWEDFITKDLLDYIDANYRTIKNSSARGISGHSMGGFGAVNLAMLHPDLFGVVYALSPGLYDQNGVQTSQLFKNTSFINQIIQKTDELSSKPDSEALNTYISYINSRFSAGDWDTPFCFAYSSAFSPNPDKKLPYINYPYSKTGSELIADSVLLKTYYNGFGNLPEKLNRYKGNFLKLVSFGFEVGTGEENTWLKNGNIYFDQLLKEENIPHEFITFAGGHENIVGQRFEQYLLPFLSKALVYDTLATFLPEVKDRTVKNFELINYPNPFNPSTIITYTIPGSEFVSLKITDILGREVETLINNYQETGSHTICYNAANLATGTYFIMLKAGEFINVKKCVLVK